MHPNSIEIPLDLQADSPIENLHITGWGHLFKKRKKKSRKKLKMH